MYMNDYVVVQGGKVFEVAHLSVVGDKFVVNLDTQDCSCKKWMIISIPCCHQVFELECRRLYPSMFQKIELRRDVQLH